MKKTSKLLLAAILACTLALTGANAEDSAVAQALNGKLVKIEDGKAVPATLGGDPEYFVLYHSASW